MTINNHQITDAHVAQAVHNLNRAAHQLASVHGIIHSGEVKALAARTNEHLESYRIRTNAAVALVSNLIANPEFTVVQEGQVVGTVRASIDSLVHDFARLNVGDQPGSGMGATNLLSAFLARPNW